MAAGSFQETSLGWQWQQLQQRIGEWVEWIISGVASSTSGLPQWSLPDWLLKGLFWVIVVTFATWASWQLFCLLRPYLNTLLQHQTQQAVEQLSRKQSRELTASAWLQRSQAMQKQKNYGEACRALYMAMLQQLHEANLIPQESSRTDGEYRQLVQQLPKPQPYQLLINIHERWRFGNATISSETFDRCQQAYQEIEAP